MRVRSVAVRFIQTLADGLSRVVEDEFLTWLGNLPGGLLLKRRPDQIIGPPKWSKALDYGREEGWVLAPDQLDLHKDHIHIGYVDEQGTHNTR